MGTRNLTCVVLNKEFKVAQYCQWDGYPMGQGRIIRDFIVKIMNKDLFKERLLNLKYLNFEELSILSKIADFKNKWPQLHRACGANILALIQKGSSKEIFLNIEFAEDVVFCEWCYVIDMDREVLEIYEGFNEKPLTEKDRFYFLQERDRVDKILTRNYYPVRLLKAFTFDELFYIKWWDYKTGMIWHSPAKKEKKGWFTIDCGCSGGLQWGGEEPRECERCGGNGFIWWHKKSKVFAQYPGGKFISGRGELTELELKGNLS